MYICPSTTVKDDGVARMRPLYFDYPCPTAVIVTTFMQSALNVSMYQTYKQRPVRYARVKFVVNIYA